MPRTVLTIAEQAALAADNGLKVIPLKPMGKIPWVKDWPTAATTSVEQVYAWFDEKPQSNYGIATGHDGLFLVDLDGAEGLRWWREQGFQPGAEVRTPNGGMHVYYRNFEVEVQTNAKKIHPHVDVRGVGGQGAGPGSMLPTGSYKGDILAIVNAPEAPPELMAIIPEKQTYTQVEYSGEQVTEASEKERQGVAWIINRLEALPDVWHEGAGWHDAVFESAGWLSRMVNSGAYAMTEDGALTILLSHTPTYPGWGEEKIIEQWLSAVQLNVGKFADPPSEDEDIPGLLPLMKAQEGAPEYDSKGRQFLDLIWSDASSDTEGARWDRRRQIFLESFRAGLEMRQAFSLAAGSTAAEALMTQHDGRLMLWKEAKKAHAEYLAEAAGGLTILERDTLEQPIVAPLLSGPQPVVLLNDSEREAMGSESFRWWGVRYLEWVTDSLRLANMPYHRLHMWVLLSVVFGLVAYVPREGKKIGVNLWGVLIGESSSGKTEALDKAEATLFAAFRDDDPMLGVDATTEALHDALIGRDGKPSYQLIDEAHALLAELAGTKGFRGDLVTKWTEFYEGVVKASLRSTKKEISGKRASTSFSLLMQGTSEKMRRAMNAALWEQGFLVRALFVVGENIQPSEDDLDVRLIDGDADQAYNAMPRQYAAEWSEIRRRLERYGDFPLKMEFESDALNRLNAGMRRMRAELRQMPNQVALKPYAARFPNQVLKMAALVALSEARVKVSVRDVLIALHASEEFLGAAIYMAKLTTDTDFAQQVDAVERVIAEKGGKLDTAKLYRHFQAQPIYEVNRLVDQLVAQRRAHKKLEAGGSWTVSLIQDTTEGRAAA